jgi:hypothetical protein
VVHGTDFHEKLNWYPSANKKSLFRDQLYFRRFFYADLSCMATVIEAIHTNSQIFGIEGMEVGPSKSYQFFE